MTATRTEQDVCSVKWCDELTDHRGPHVRYLGSTTMRSGNVRALVQVVETGDDRHPEIVIVDGDDHVTTLKPNKADLTTLTRLLRSAM